MAGFILHGRAAALLVVTGTVLMPLVSWLSVAALGLVTLRRGPGEGAFLAGLATLVLLGATVLTGASPMAAVVPMLALWIPALIAGAVLRETVSWPYALEILATVMVAGMLVFHAVLGDATAFWVNQLTDMQAELQAAGTAADEGERIVSALAERLTGVVFGGLLALVMGGLVLARYWQALLFNPGGFRDEFHALRLQSGFAMATLGLLLASLALGPGVVNDAGSVLVTVFVLQGLAVIHAIARHRGWPGPALIPVYVLLPVLGRLVAFVGLFDVFTDLRRRLIGSDNAP